MGEMTIRSEMRAKAIPLRVPYMSQMYIAFVAFVSDWWVAKLGPGVKRGKDRTDR